jgi:peptide-methionine (R)-S-oxide reductase
VLVKSVLSTALLSVPSLPFRAGRTLPRVLGRVTDPRTAGIGFGAGRVAIGAAAIVAPEPASRVLGLDTATARRAAVLARMAGARDMALGAGALAAAVSGRPLAGWLLAGAFADAADATVLGVALQRGDARGAIPLATALGAGGSALLGVLAAARAR